MKIKFDHVLLILYLAILSPAGIYCARAQDASYPIPDAFEEAEAERDRVIYSPGEAEPATNNKVHAITSQKDTVSVKAGNVRNANSPTGQKNAPNPPASQNDDSVLSFNFLYYLFEKYKMQDIVD